MFRGSELGIYCLAEDSAQADLVSMMEIRLDVSRETYLGPGHPTSLEAKGSVVPKLLFGAVCDCRVVLPELPCR